MLRSLRLSLLVPASLALAALQAGSAPLPGGPAALVPGQEVEDEDPDPTQPDPRALIEAAAQAAREVRSGTYQAHSTVSSQAGVLGSLSGEVRFICLEAPAEGAPADPLGALLFVRAKAPDATGAEVPFELAYDGEQVRGHIGDEQVVWFSTPADAGLELLEVGDQLLMRPLFELEPLADALGDAELTLGPEVTLDGVRCREVVVQHGVERRHDRVTWAFALDDHLPRRRVAEVHRHGRAQTETLELTALRKNVGIHPSVFSMRLARGFELKPFVSRRPSAQLLEVGRPAPELVLPDAAGGEFDLAAQRGRVIVLDFWSTWASPCRQTMPLVQKLHARFADDERVQVYGVATQERPDSDPQAFMREGGLEYGLLLKGERVAPAYRVTELPTLYVIGTEGRVLYALNGIEPALEPLLGLLIERHLNDESGK
jgi:thiol-disulfide isomerase/thioredoxin